jgi:hypothetical protein
MSNSRYFCPIVTKFGVPRQIIVKVFSIRCHGNPSSWSHTDICVSTDRRTEGLTVWYHFTWGERFYGDLMSPTTKNVHGSWCQISTNFLYSRLIFIDVLNIKLSQKFHQWGPRWYIRTDMTKLIGAFHDYANAHKNSCDTLHEFLTLWSSTENFGQVWAKAIS